MKANLKIICLFTYLLKALTYSYLVIVNYTILNGNRVSEFNKKLT